MSKKPSQPAAAASSSSSSARIDVGDLAEVVTRSIARALNVKDPARLPIRIIVGIVAEPPDYRTGGGGVNQ